MEEDFIEVYQYRPRFMERGPALYCNNGISNGDPYMCRIISADDKYVTAQIEDPFYYTEDEDDEEASPPSPVIVEGLKQFFDVDHRDDEVRFKYIRQRRREQEDFEEDWKMDGLNGKPESN